jgi:L-asparagine oxygenase
MLVSLGLGEVVAFREEKGGALVQGVVPVPGREHAQGNMGSVELTMHTENAFHPHRPDFVGLFCLRSDHDRTAGLRIASVRRALVHLPEHAAAVLAEPRFITEPPASFGGLDAGPETHAVLNGGPVDPTIRVDFASTRATDDEAARSMELLGEAVRNVTRVLRLEPGDVAFVDNRIALHGRTAFQPRYDGEDRWLLRTFVHLDLRRSTSSRLSGGNVLLSGGGFR